MTLLEDFIGKRRILELLEIVDKRGSIYILELVKTQTGWNSMTATRLFKVLVKNGVLSCTITGGLGENIRNVYRLTPKGSKVLEHLREIQKLLNGRLGNK